MAWGVRSFHLNTCLVPIMMDVPCRWRGERTYPSRSGEDLKTSPSRIPGRLPTLRSNENNNNPEIPWTFHHSNPSITGIPTFSRRHMSWKHLDVTSSGKKEPRSSGAGEFYLKTNSEFFFLPTLLTPPIKIHQTGWFCSRSKGSCFDGLPSRWAWGLAACQQGGWSYEILITQ